MVRGRFVVRGKRALFGGLVAGSLGAGLPPAIGPATKAGAGLGDSYRSVSPPTLDESPLRVLGQQPTEFPRGSGVPVPIASPQVPQLQGLFGGRFAGAWDVPIAPGRILPTVALVGANPDDAQRVSSLLGTTDVQIVNAHRSLRELEDLRTRVLAELDRAGIRESMVGVNVPANVVTVEVDVGSSVPAWLADWLVALSNFPGVSVRTAQIGLVDYPNPNVAGQRIWISNSGTTSTSCTSGFAMSNAFGRFMTTAAHCATGNGQTVRGASSDNGPPQGSYGTTIGWQPRGTLAQPSIVPGDFVAWYKSDASPFIYGPTRVVRSAAEPLWLEPDICFRGATSGGERCGGVSDVNVLLTDEQGRRYSAFCIGMSQGTNARPGDSGAPIYRAIGSNQASARGVLTYTIVNSTSFRTCGTTIAAVTSTYNASVLTK